LALTCEAASAARLTQAAVASLPIALIPFCTILILLE
jgi:hypothetical protein